MTPSFELQIDSKTRLTRSEILHGADRYLISSITGLEYRDETQKINGLTTGRTRILTIIFPERKPLKLGSTLFLNVNRTSFDNIERAYKALAQMTFRQRLDYYTNNWKAFGYFDYENVRIHANGVIEQKGKKVSISEAFKQGRVCFGFSVGVSWIGFSGSNPFCVNISQKVPGKFFATSIGFDRYVNSDVIFAILNSFCPQASRTSGNLPARTTGSKSPTPMRVPNGLSELEAYTLVAQELENGQHDQGLWLKCYSEADGDESKASAAYNRERAKALIRQSQEPPNC